METLIKVLPKCNANDLESNLPCGKLETWAQHTPFTDTWPFQTVMEDRLSPTSSPHYASLIMSQLTRIIRELIDNLIMQMVIDFYINIFH